MQVFARWLLVVCSVSWIGLSFVKQPLPQTEEIVSKLMDFEPMQEEALDDAVPLQLTQEGYSYDLEPVAQYQVRGLVVSTYDSSAWYDIYHENDPYNIKDICLVWGENLQSGVYRRVSFRSGQFTCYFSWRENGVRFNPRELGNNHVLPANEGIERQLKDIQRGDQVELEGYLVNYTVKKDRQVYGERTTSTTRDDTGSGACEVLYVTGVKVFKRPLLPLSLLRSVSGGGLLLVGLALVGQGLARAYKRSQSP